MSTRTLITLELNNPNLCQPDDALHVLLKQLLLTGMAHTDHLPGTSGFGDSNLPYIPTKPYNKALTHRAKPY